MSSRENQQFGPYGEYTENETAARYGAAAGDDTGRLPPTAMENRSRRRTEKAGYRIGDLGGGGLCSPPQ